MLKNLLRSLRAARSGAAAEKAIARARAAECAGDWAGAAGLYRQGLAVAPDAHDLHALLGAAEHRLGRMEAALRHYEQALLLAPGENAALHANLGGVLKALGRTAESVAAYERAIAAGVNAPEIRYNLGLALHKMGRIPEAETAYRAAIALNPDFQQAHSSLLCLYGLGDYDKKRALSEHRAWAQRHADPWTEQAAPHENSLDPDRILRIGYVSADLRGHSVAFFIEPILAGHDPSRFQVFCYDNWGGAEDNVTLRLRGYVHAWRKIHGLSDDDAAALIRADAIDILVDLSGHTAGNRLTLFARKPAPLQATWFGYMCTTGMKAMDYRITDAHLDPPGQTEHTHAERLLRLPSAAAFAPAPDSPNSGPLPALLNGYLTFGSFNNYAKINDAVISCWCEVLREMPDSRLLLVMDGGDQHALREAALARFASHGVGAARIEVVARQPFDGFLRLLQRVDIALDPFPYSGGTTSLHTLWMGVPIVTLEGDSEISRSTSGMLRGAGLDTWIAAAPDEYVRIACARAGDVPALAALRAALRGRMRDTPLFDGAAVTRGLERAYHDIWREHVAAMRYTDAAGSA